MTKTATSSITTPKTATGQDAARPTFGRRYGLKALISTAARMLARRQDLYVPNA